VNLHQETSPIDGAVHRQNLAILAAAASVSTRQDFVASLPDLFSLSDLYVFQAGTNLLPRATCVRNNGTNDVLIVLNGMQNYDKVQACLTGWADPSYNNDGLVYPYGSAANSLLNFILLPLPGQVYDSVTIIGHSYGGAVASHLATFLPQVGQLTRLRVYTYGSPKVRPSASYPARVAQATRRVFQNGDPVPLLPLSYDNLSQLWQVCGVGTAREWSRWQQPFSGLAVSLDGTMVPQQDPGFTHSNGPIFTLASWMTSSDAFGAVPHSLDSYQSVMRQVPAVTVPTPAPQTNRTHSVSPTPRLMDLQASQQQAIQRAQALVMADPMQAVRQIIANVVPVPNERYRGAVRGGENVVLYNGAIVAYSKTRRLRRALVRDLNRSL
jgi:pimeloyl-ACP methyl ester carboxylesterase